MAAIRRYAWEDYEHVEIRKLAREANVSISTFFNRFGGLEAFWYALAGAQFQAATRAMDREFDPKAWGDAPPGKIIRRIVEHVVTGMDCDTIGHHAHVRKAVHRLRPRQPSRSATTVRPLPTGR